MSLPPEITQPRDKQHGSRLGDVIRRLSSNIDGEVIASVRAMERVLKSVGADFHALADHFERPVGETEMKKLYDAGYSAGVLAAERRHNGASDFHSTDGKPDWKDVALYVQREKDKLPSKHHEFINKMAARTVYDNEPTANMHKYLHSLFHQLGGKVT